MRPTALFLSLGFLGLGLTAAQANLTLPVDREVGTLTCETRASGRALGSASVADCSYVSDRDGAPQSFVAVLGKRSQASGASATKLTWRVVTRNGVERPGMLAGSFSDPAEWQVAPRKSSAPLTLVGQAASLKLETPAGEGAAKLAKSFAKSLAGVELIATIAVASR